MVMGAIRIWIMPYAQALAAGSLLPKDDEGLRVVVMFRSLQFYPMRKGRISITQCQQAHFQLDATPLHETEN